MTSSVIMANWDRQSNFCFMVSASLESLSDKTVQFLHNPYNESSTTVTSLKMMIHNLWQIMTHKTHTDKYIINNNSIIIHVDYFIFNKAMTHDDS